MATISNELIARGVTELVADLLKTKRNGPLASVFDTLPFTERKESTDHVTYRTDKIEDIIAMKTPCVVNPVIS